MRGPEASTGGSGKPGPTCGTPLCGGSAPRGKPKAVDADGMGGPPEAGGGGAQLVRKGKKEDYSGRAMLY